jgi:hypothetical protein
MKRDTVVENQAGRALSLDDIPEDNFAFRQNVAMNGGQARQKPESVVPGRCRERAKPPSRLPGCRC